MKNYAALYKNELLNEILPFWEKYSLDKEFGGYFTCIKPNGEVYDTDKFIWLQARQVWMFATCYQQVEKKEDWKAICKLGADFLENYGRNVHGDWYFSLNQKGEPLVQPYNIFSDCFAAMAFGKLYEIDTQKRYAEIAKTTFDNILNGKLYEIDTQKRYAEIAKTTFDNILKRQHNPKGKYNKSVPGTRPMQNFALPMILCNLSLELEPLLGSDKVSEVTDTVIDLVMNTFYDETTGLVLENVSDIGEFVDSFEGRLLNPGHAIEAMWFIMNLGIRKNDTVLINKAEKIMFQQLEHGWDTEYGGILYFMDCKGHPPQQLEHDQKLWWVHLETLVALAKTYAYNQNPKAAKWFKKVHEYTWSHFRDTEHGGEWFGYLNREGKAHLNLKGGKWKGCFHVPRALLEVWKTLENSSL